MNEGLAWLGFWICLAAVYIWDCKVFMSGRDSLFQAHKTEAEKRLRDAAVREAEKRAAS